jgi:hypothetical protein
MSKLFGIGLIAFFYGQLVHLLLRICNPEAIKLPLDTHLDCPYSIQLTAFNTASCCPGKVPVKE